MAKKKAGNRPAVRPLPETEQTHQLADLFLYEASFVRLRIKLGPPPEHISLTLSFGAAKAPDKPDHLVMKVILSAEASYQPDGELAFKIQAGFLVAYKLAGIIPDNLPPERVQEFGKKQACIHVWPYWREFVQSSTTRMGLPALRMPLFVSQKVKFEMTSK